MPASFKIASDGPPDFAWQYDLVLQIQYEIDRFGVYTFSYKRQNAPASGHENLFADLEVGVWKPFRKGKLHAQPAPRPETAFAEAVAAGQEQVFGIDPEYETHIDIPIRGDTTVYIETVGDGDFADFYWSNRYPALMTARRRDRAYGGLAYWDGQDWTPAIPRNIDCRRIRFNARHNRDRILYDDRNHGFGLSVRLRDRNGHLISLLVDPDIQNPSV